jgi:Mn2+/Fe2+ NRAMP family transporter
MAAFEHFAPIRGALATVGHADHRQGLAGRLKTLLAVVGPGLIVMVGDNDAGAFGTYGQAGQNFGTALLWTLPLLVPALYVNQEMALRLGAITRVGHARLILERFGRFWATFSVLDLLLLNALTLVTEFIGISLALDDLGLSRGIGIVAAAGALLAAAATGDFRRFERFSLLLVLGSLLLVPVALVLHPPVGQVLHDLAVPGLPAGSRLSEVLLLVVAIVGTTVAPWQLFFQQSYVIDKRITGRFLPFARIDLMIGIVLVMLGAAAIVLIAAQVFAGRPEFGHFVDVGRVAAAIAAEHGRTLAIVFDIALIDSCVIGAAAISLATAYAIGDVLAVRHSLHRRVTEAKLFYAVYGGLVLLAAGLVLVPTLPLGLLINGVQTLAGVLLPSATVFLLLLCNDRAVLGPWVNSPRLNLITGTVVAALVILSVLLTTSVLWPGLGDAALLGIALTGAAGALFAAVIVLSLDRSSRRTEKGRRLDLALRRDWTMPALERLAPLRLTLTTKTWLIVLRGYVILAGGSVMVRLAAIAWKGLVT